MKHVQTESWCQFSSVSKVIVKSSNLKYFGKFVQEIGHYLKGHH